MERAHLADRRDGAGRSPRGGDRLVRSPGFDARKNAGLGLELVLGMTRQIRGEAKIENDPGGGTRTTIFFPSLLSSETAKTEPPIQTDLP